MPGTRKQSMHQAHQAHGEGSVPMTDSASGNTPQQRPAQESIWSRSYLVLMAANFFQSMAAFMSGTTIPLYLDSMGALPSVVGIVVGAFAITALLVRPFAGPAFDSFSRKKLLLGAQSIIAVSLVLYGFSGSVEAMFAARLLHGIGVGCAGPVAMSLVSEYLPASRLASGISIYALAQSFAQVIGPALGLWLIEVVGFSATYFIAAGSIAVSVLGIVTLREKPRERPPYQLKLGRMFAREAIDKAVVLALFSTSFACVGSYLVLYGSQLGIEGMGVYFTVYALCLLGTRPLFGKMADRHGAARVLLVGVLCFAASFVLLSQVRSLGGLLAVAVVGSAGFGACVPLVQSLTLGSVPLERRGAASNTSFTGMDVGMLVGPVMGGFVVELLHPIVGTQVQAYSAMWLVMLVPLAIAFAIIVRWNLRRTGQR